MDRHFSRIAEGAVDLRSADQVIANLEGPIVGFPPTISQCRPQTPALGNSVDVLTILRESHVSAVGLANNHTYDLPDSVRDTIELLATADIASFGAGAGLALASEPLVLKYEDSVVKVFAFGWDVIGSIYATLTREGVNPLEPSHLFQVIRTLRAEDKTSCVVFFMHWNYELEVHPQPAHRQLAHDLIREGVDVIVGLHPHVAQGAELIDGKPIVYSLGNWFFPPRRLGHILLRYPPISNRELAFEVEILGRQVRQIWFHWHQFDAEREHVMLEQTEGVNGQILKELTPFAGMTHAEYTQWFRKNRARRKGLPVYENYQSGWMNRVKDYWVNARQFIVNLLVSLELKGGPH